MSERFSIHLDQLSESILSDSSKEQPYDNWVGGCVVANGCFDILHPGHLSLLSSLAAAGRSRGLRPIVALNSDDSIRKLKGQNRPIVPLESRVILLNNLKWPLTVVIFEEDTPQRLMDLLKPQAVLKGAEYDLQTVIKWRESEVVTVPMVDGWSTSGIIRDTH